MLIAQAHNGAYLLGVSGAHYHIGSKVKILGMVAAIIGVHVCLHPLGSKHVLRPDYRFQFGYQSRSQNLIFHI
ncbi:hypothetical protein GCM10027175_11930 [Hymenobacter latericoloratus]